MTNWSKFKPAAEEKIEYIFGLPIDELKKRLEAIKKKNATLNKRLSKEHGKK